MGTIGSALWASWIQTELRGAFCSFFFGVGSFRHGSGLGCLGGSLRFIPFVGSFRHGSGSDFRV